jgi:hypothetical protein
LAQSVPALPREGRWSIQSIDDSAGVSIVEAKEVSLDPDDDNVV